MLPPPRRRAAALLALLAPVLVALLTGLPAASAAQQAVPALTPAGRTDDGWEVHRLADGRLPQALPRGEGLRAEVRFLHDGRPRAVRLLVPDGLRGPAPLLLALHGLYQSAQTVERDQRWAPLARREGVVLAYGMGSSASWNAGTCCGRGAEEGVDDVGYLDRVVQIAAALQPVHPRRLHVTGFSNGAMMAYRYACERRERVAGVLAVAGTVAADCRGRSDVAVLHVHGVADRTVPLLGLDWSAPLRTALRPVSRTATVFGPRISAELLPTYGHGWPTAARGGYDATREGWAFLARHPLR